MRIKGWTAIKAVHDSSNLMSSSNMVVLPQSHLKQKNDMYLYDAKQGQETTDWNSVVDLHVICMRLANVSLTPSSLTVVKKEILDFTLFFACVPRFLATSILQRLLVPAAGASLNSALLHESQMSEQSGQNVDSLSSCLKVKGKCFPMTKRSSCDRL